MSKVAERKAQLHLDLIVQAKRRIAENGVNQLRARDLAEDVGCSLGAIYNVFSDLNSLVLHVSRETLADIDRTMQESGMRCIDLPPSDALIDLSHTYYDFVLHNNYLWRALFESAMPTELELPEWLISEQIGLLDHIIEPLNKLMPWAEQAQLLRTARLLFSSVHGVINLAVDERTIGLPIDQVKGELSFLVGMFVAGVQRQA